MGPGPSGIGMGIQHSPIGRYYSQSGRSGQKGMAGLPGMSGQPAMPPLHRGKSLDLDESIAATQATTSGPTTATPGKNGPTY